MPRDKSRRAVERLDGTWLGASASPFLLLLSCAGVDTLQTLRRNASFLDDHAQNVEDIESDHIGMARFSSADNQSYQSIASFIVKLAYCQSLKARAINS